MFYRVRKIILVVIGCVIMTFSLSGCMSSKYKLAAQNTPPSTPLNLTVSTSSIDASVNSVIIIGGPGSWKRTAYWDEYVISVTNRSETTIKFTSAALTDFEGRPVMQGNNPWELEQQSKAWIENYDTGLKDLGLKIGASSIVAGAVATPVFVSSATFVGATAVTVMPVVALAVLPPTIFSSLIVNSFGEKRIETQFNQRLLVLPATILPGQTAHGSLFFRITPGPQKLTLFFDGASTGMEASIDLKPLSDLHIDTTPQLKHQEQKKSVDSP